jgi:hypothetical protein
MRRPATLIYVLASLSLLTAPFRDAHAHLGSHHDHVVVHSGHSHDFDQNAAVHLEADHGADHDDEPLSDNDNELLVDEESGIVDSSVQVVNLKSDSVSLDFKSKNVPAAIDISSHRFEHPPDKASRFAVDLPSECRPFQSRLYLHPPMRGPPRI